MQYKINKRKKQIICVVFRATTYVELKSNQKKRLKQIRDKIYKLYKEQQDIIKSAEKGNSKK